MDLNKIYAVQEMISGMVADGILTKDDLEDIALHVSVTPSIHYGIDKEFYKLEHDGSARGFVPNEGNIYAKIEGVNFVIDKLEEKES